MPAGSGVDKNLAQAAGADLYESKPETPYTRADLNWMDKKSHSSVEINDKSFRPVLADRNADIAAYDIILLGFLIWLVYHNIAALVTPSFSAYLINDRRYLISCVILAMRGYFLSS